MPRFSCVGLLACLVVLAQLSTAGTSFAAETDEQKIKQANDQFYAALNDMFQGNVEPMKQVWSHADDVTYLGPAGGMQIGWNEVEAMWEEQSALKLGGKVEPENLQFQIGLDIAVVNCFETGENFSDGKPEKVSIRATNVFRNEFGTWKMIGHHTDLLPFLAK